MIETIGWITVALLAFIGGIGVRFPPHRKPQRMRG